MLKYQVFLIEKPVHYSALATIRKMPTIINASPKAKNSSGLGPILAMLV
jgi:hypothetical protein